MKKTRTKIEWTVSRMVGLFAALKEPVSVDELKQRYGIGIRELRELEVKVLGNAEETSPTGSLHFSLQFETVRGKTMVRLLNQPILAKSVGVSMAEAHLAQQTLSSVDIPEPTQTILNGITTALGAAIKKGKYVPPSDFLFTAHKPPFLDDNAKKLAQAVQDQREARFLYGRKNPVQRYVQPFNLRRDAGEWRLLTFDLERQDLRVFLLPKIKQVKIGGPFEWPARYTKSQMKSMDLSRYRRNGTEVPVDLKIRNPALERFQSLFPYVHVPPKDKGWKKLSIYSADPQWVAHTFLYGLGDVEILAPPDFRQAWQAEIKAVKALYSK
jgi:predicted DNA-binding transcriptional regulator YafY